MIKFNASAILIVGLLLFAFTLRVYRLDYADITGDEAWSVTVAGWPLSEVVSSEAEFNPPLYHILLFGMMRLVGLSPFAVRYLSVIAGMLGIALISRLGFILSGRKMALFSLVAAVVSPFLVYYAQEARFYSTVLLGSAASLVVFAHLHHIQNENKPPPKSIWLLYGLSSLGLIFTHYYAFALLVSQGFFTLFSLGWKRRWQQLGRWCLVWGGIVTLFIPWILYSASFLSTRNFGRFEQWTIPVFIDLTRQLLLAYAAGITLPPAHIWGGWGIVTLAFLGFLGLLLQQHRQAAWIAFAVVSGCLIFAWGMNPFAPFFYPRYLLVGMPAFLILLAAGLLAFSRWHKGLAILVALAVLSVNAISLQHYYFDPTYLKGTYGRLMAAIQGQAKDGDVILLHNPLQESLYEIYGDPEMPAAMLDRAQLFDDEAAQQQLSKLTNGYERAWLIEFGNPAEYDPQHRAQRWLGEHGSRGYYANYVNGGVVTLFVLEDGGNAGIDHAINSNINDEILLHDANFQPKYFAGDPLLLTLTWQATAAIPRPYTVFVHLIAPDGSLAAQIDGQPGGGAKPTQTWLIDEMIEDNHAILLPADLTPGMYTLNAGMYLWPELTRLTVLSSEQLVIENSIELGTIEIKR